jgi:N-acetylmuramoyl-L-alanine amidase
MHKKLRAIASCLSLLGCLYLAAGPVAAAEKLKGARVSTDLERTRVVLDLTDKVRYSTQTLANPDRLVVDLRDTRNAASLKKLPLQDTPIRAVRAGIRNGHDLRLVFDLTAPANASVSQRGDQLVIDLRERGGKVAGRKSTSAKATARADKPSPPQPVKNAHDGKRDVVITIDAGHGGHDTGAIGPGKAREKVVTLAIARELAAILERERGYKPVLTRSSDSFIPLRTRATIARKAQADLFVSIHADAFTDPSARGASVFALSDRGATSTMAAFLAAEANKSDQIGGVSTAGKDDNLVKVLADLSMTSSLDTSIRIGSRILGEMGDISRLHSRRVEQAGFMVLKSPDTPSLLVETGFISNPHEAKLLTSRDYQRRMARAIYNGIHHHFSQNPPPNTWLAWVKRNRSSEQALADRDDPIGRP